MQFFQPNPRFKQYTQIIKNNKVIGFKLDNNQYEFLFDKYGGWYDEQGRYFNANAIQDNLDQHSEQENQAEEQQQDNQKPQHHSAGDQIPYKHPNQKENQKNEVIRDLTQIVDSYPEGQEINHFISIKPYVNGQDKILQEFFYQKLNKEFKIKDGQIIGLFDHQLAKRIIEYQGTKMQHIQQKPTLYIDIELFNSVDVGIHMSKGQLLDKFNKLGLQKNIDYANVQQKQRTNGLIQCYFQYNRNIHELLNSEMELIQQ